MGKWYRIYEAQAMTPFQYDLQLVALYGLAAIGLLAIGAYVAKKLR